MSRKQSLKQSAMKFYQEVQDAVAKWAAETKPEDCRVADNRIVAKPFEDLEIAIARLCMAHQVRESYATFLLSAAVSALINCCGRMDRDKFMAELTEIVSVSMAVAYSLDRRWVDVERETIRAMKEGEESPTLH